MAKQNFEPKEGQPYIQLNKLLGNDPIETNYPTLQVDSHEFLQIEYRNFLVSRL